MEIEVESCDDCNVDFVLVHDARNVSNHRLRFEGSLSDEGLTLEREDVQDLTFVKLRVPEEVLYEYGEVLKLYMPIKFNLKDLGVEEGFLERIKKYFQPSYLEKDKVRLNAVYSRDKDYLFDKEDPAFFNASARISVVSYMLDRARYGDGKYELGLDALLSKGAYLAAYPLHDGDLNDVDSMRHKLWTDWGSLGTCLRFQPLDDVKDYFGAKVAFYFAWLGFYTRMLIPAAVLGVACLVYGAATVNGDEVSREICTTNVTMCPLCDKYCPFWALDETCMYSRLSYVVDNGLTVFFAIGVSLWCAAYLELWKRYSAGLAHRWGLAQFEPEDEPARPEYVDRQADLRGPLWKAKLASFAFSYMIVVFWLLLALGVMFGVLLYRMSLATSEKLNRDYVALGLYLMPITSSLLNLIGICVLNGVYNRVTKWLTDKELHRTQTEYEDSLTLKTFLFQFVNVFTSIFYIAFIKGKFVGNPSRYYRIFGFRQEECQPGGCLIELSIQLFVLMAGQQIIDNVVEFAGPCISKIRKESKDGGALLPQRRIFADYKLVNVELFDEYLKMVMQYGLVTIFVVALPIAPLLAFVNNLFELRLDARKFLAYSRRPVPKRVKSIGVWLHIMNTLCRLAIISNGFIIAFSSTFVVKLVYALRSSRDESFLQYTLGRFTLADFEADTLPVDERSGADWCAFPESKNAVEYWSIMAARLAFVVVYQNIVGLVVTCLQWAVADVPDSVRRLMKLEKRTIEEMVLNEGRRRRNLRRRGQEHSNRVVFSETAA